MQFFSKYGIMNLVIKMILMKDIIKEGNPILRQKAEEVKLPLSEEDKLTLVSMLKYLMDSNDPKISEQYGLRPGVGLAAPQIGISKRMFVIFGRDLAGKMHILPLINPVILSHSKEMTYLPYGEGCLSVDRETHGLTPRYKEIKIKAHYFDVKTGKVSERTYNLKDFISIVFQHENDHLDGILYVDTMKDELPNIKPLYEIKKETTK